MSAKSIHRGSDEAAAATKLPAVTGRVQSSTHVEGMHAIVAGVTATAAMSLVMRAAQASQLLRRPPPATITERALGLAPSTSSPATGLVNGIAHFGYGATLAIPFAALRRAFPGRTSLPLAGMAYGLAIYVANYQAMLPMLQLMPPAPRDAPGRVRSMIAAHLVYGAVLELLVRRR